MSIRHRLERPAVCDLEESVDYQDIRVFGVRDFDAWLVFYRALDSVQIERVLHGARDLRRVLEES